MSQRIHALISLHILLAYGCSELNKARTEVHMVSELFSRRDPMRKYMNQIVEMASEYGMFPRCMT